ncbi:hypothetical protein EVAR_5121_1 [Eumeta japonica]|uniref:Uncharacterized protein n=1 Tax=Eumeta variegata TaxID=151549 RepID=A0A4C1SX24_EUMVA|nr:hypothetical protein EVAR_5121_1 [Eumeta japonica]
MSVVEPLFKSGKAVLWSTLLQHENGSVRVVRYHTLTEYRHDFPAPFIVFRPVSESSDSPLPLHHSNTSLSINTPSHILFLFKKPPVAAVASLGLLVFMAGDDHLLSDG